MNQASTGMPSSRESAGQSGRAVPGASEAGDVSARPAGSATADSPRGRYEGRVLARVKQEEETLRVQGGSTPRFGTAISPIASPSSQASLASQGGSPSGPSRRRTALPVLPVPQRSTSAPPAASASRRLFANPPEAEAPAPSPSQMPSLRLLASQFADSSDGSGADSPPVVATDSPSAAYAQGASHGRGGTPNPQGRGKGRARGIGPRSRGLGAGPEGDTPTRPLLEPPSFRGMDR